MPDISVIVCAHNPRADYLERTLGGLQKQSLPREQWELLVVDNASSSSLADRCDLSWHGQARHLRENALGLMAARFHGIAESRGRLLVFVDDDNVLAPDFLEQAWVICRRYPHVGVFGSGNLHPELEVEPPPEIRSSLSMLAIRNVLAPQWSNNPLDSDAIPWGAGLCVTRPVAREYQPFVERLGIIEVLGRRGAELFSGDDDVFSWVAASLGSGFGVFPALRLTHLIGAHRLNQAYVLNLLRTHAFSHGALRYMLAGTQPRRIDWFRYVHVLLHGIRNGGFSMRCQWAQSRGEDSAAHYVTPRRVRGVRNSSGESQQVASQPQRRTVLDNAYRFRSLDAHAAGVGMARPDR